MELIIGGAFQGKKEYAKKQHPDIFWKDAADLSEEEILHTQGIINFQEYIRKEMEEERNPAQIAEKMLKENPDAIIISQEVGYGVVPIDAFEREYREMVGRICTKLASGASRVTRVICGVGMVIKDA